MGYWSRGAERAWNDTRPWLGLGKPRGLVLRFLAMLVFGGAVGAALVAGDRGARANWYWAFVIALAAFFVFVFVWNFLRAPELLDREAQARIAALSEPTVTRDTAQEEIDALQSAYATGRELLRLKDVLPAAELKPRVDEWFAATATLVKRIGSKNQAFTFATAADFASVPSGEKAPSGLLLTRLAKLKQIIDRPVQQKEGMPRVPGLKRAAPES